MQHEPDGPMTTRAAAPRRWERVAPAGALGFLLMVALGALLVGEGTPSSQAPEAEIAAYFAEHRGGMLLNTALVTLGAFGLYPWFLASLWRATVEAEGSRGVCAVAGLLGGIGVLGPLLVQAVSWGAAALEAGEGRNPAVAAALMDLGNMGFFLFPVPGAVLVAATSLAAPPGVLLPGWLRTSGLVLALVMTVGGVLLLAPPVMFGLFGLWMVAVTFSLLRRGAPP